MAKAPETDEPFRRKVRSRSAALDGFRENAATVVRIVFIVFAVILALGAFLVSVRNNVSSDNGLVKFIWNFADAIDGPFSRDNGIFKFDGKNAETKDAVVNWGIAAIVYLVISNLIQRLLRPTARPVVKR
jgi:ABC-type transport system involved in multi-copper enzyme maturation permease subunit